MAAIELGVSVGQFNKLGKVFICAMHTVDDSKHFLQFESRQLKLNHIKKQTKLNFPRLINISTARPKLR